MSRHELKLPIHATPGARHTEPSGEREGSLRLRLAAPPVDGKANTALIAWAAKAFGLRRSQVELLHGAASRHKLLLLRFDTAADLQAARQQVQTWLSGGTD